MTALREAVRPPFFVGALAIVVFVVWASKDAGFAVTTWYPGALFLLVLLAVVLAAYQPARSGLSGPTLVAIALFGAFALWCAASISWSHAKGTAWDGANRTFLYVIVYALFALLPWRRASLLLLLASFSVAVAVIGVVDIARAAHGTDPTHFFIYGRLAAPAGYPNGACALYVLATWPVAYAAVRRELPPLVRGLLMATAIVLAELALLTESRASLVAVPIALLVYLALVPARLRALLSIVVVGATLAAAHGPLLAPYGPLTHHLDARSELRGAFQAIVLSALVVAVAWSFFAFVDQRVDVPKRFVRIAGYALLDAALVAVLIAGVIFVTHSPINRLKHGWHDFRSGYPAATSSSSHFSSGLGNNRYDFWRVALIEFRDHPVAGVGVDNFAEDYLAERRSTEEPLYPHSLELRVLAQTGIVGTLLFAGFAIAAVAAAAGVFRASDLPAGVARAGLAATAYFAIHGTIDWFWEFPGLAAPAVAWLGLAASWGRVDVAGPRRESRTTRLVTSVAGTGVVLALGVSFFLPWWSKELQNRASGMWRSSPASAFNDLNTARRLNPLSPDPDLVAGAIASRLDRVGRMRQAFRAALNRDEHLWYAHFELALAEAALGRRNAALAQLDRAQRHDPREKEIRTVRRLIVAGRRLDRDAIDAVFLGRVRSRVGR